MPPQGLLAAGAATGPAAAPLLVGALGLVLMSGFRSDATGAPQTARGLVHRIAASSLFCSLPAAALLLGRRFGGQPGWHRLARPQGLVGGAGGATMAVFLATYLPGYGFPPPGGRFLTAVEGLAERALPVPDLALIVLLAVRLAHCVAVARTAWVRQRGGTAPTLRASRVGRSGRDRVVCHRIGRAGMGSGRSQLLRHAI